MNKIIAKGYVRVSTDEQAKHGQSISVQIKIIKEYCKNNKLNYGGYYSDEGRSGTNINRPALQQMLQDASEGKFNTLIVQAIDRVARDTKDYLTIKSLISKYEVALVSLTESMLDNSVYGQLVEEVIAAINSFQPRLTGSKAKSTMLEKAKQGWYPSYAPIGYKNIKNKKNISRFDQRIIVRDADEGKHVKKIFDLYATRTYSVDDIIEEMHERGMRTRNGAKKINRNTIYYVLRNPFYWGLLKWSTVERIGLHEPLISKELFDTCQRIREEHNLYACRKRKHVFLLRGLLFCETCGSRYTAEWHKVNSSLRKKIAYYHCSQIRKGARCSEPAIEKELLEERISELLKDFQFNGTFVKKVIKEAEKLIGEQRGVYESKRKSISAQRRELEKKRDSLEDKLLSETIDDEAYKRITGRVDKALLEVEQQELSIDQNRMVSSDTLRNIMVLSGNIYKAYKEAPIGLKKKYLSLIFKEIKIKNGEIFEVTPHEIFAQLKDINEVIINNLWLRGLDSNQQPYS